MGANPIAAAAFIFIYNGALPMGGIQELGQYTILQCISNKLMFKLERTVARVLPVQHRTADEAKGGSALGRFHGGYEIGSQPRYRAGGQIMQQAMRRISYQTMWQQHQPVDQVPTGFLRAEDAGAFVFLRLEPQGLDVKDSAVVPGYLITEGGGSHALRSVSRLIQDKKVGYQVIIREAFGLPGGVQGILGNGLAIHIGIYMLSLGCVIGPGIVGESALSSSAFIVIGPGAFVLGIISHLKAIDVKLTHVIPDSVKILYQFLKFSHGTHLINNTNMIIYGRNGGSQLFLNDLPHRIRYNMAMIRNKHKK